MLRKVEVRSLAELLELTITHRLAAEVAAVRGHPRLV